MASRACVKACALGAWLGATALVSGAVLCVNSGMLPGLYSSQKMAQAGLLVWSHLAPAPSRPWRPGMQRGHRPIAVSTMRRSCNPPSPILPLRSSALRRRQYEQYARRATMIAAGGALGTWWGFYAAISASSTPGSKCRATPQLQPSNTVFQRGAWRQTGRATWRRSNKLVQVHRPHCPPGFARRCGYDSRATSPWRHGAASLAVVRAAGVRSRSSGRP